MSAIVPKLGIGLNYQESLKPFIVDASETFDYLEVVPDILWHDRGVGGRPRYVDDEEGVAFVRAVSRQKPVVAHSIGLSIGSAHRLDTQHVEHLAAWWQWLGFPWHSDHLAYNVAESEDGSDVLVGVPLPLPFDRETIDLVSERIAHVTERIPAPFALENNAYYFNYPGQEMEEPEFLNELSARGGCHLLLDLHNLYVNNRNHGVDALDFLERLELERVIEIHLAGGVEYDGYYIDGHSGPVPDEVWSLAEWTVPRCPNLGGITFELVGSWLPRMGETRLAEDLGRMREVWQASQPVPDPVAA